MSARARVAVVDYGMGNLRSVAQAVVHAAAADGHRVEVQVCHDAAALASADRIVLPGQGAMRDCMAALAASGVREVLLQRVAEGTPLLGVCVGLQMLLRHSEEQDTPGLGLIPGEVRRFRLEGQRQGDGSRFKVPQMGWNRVAQAPRDGLPGGAVHPMWAGIDDNAWFYFVHSFYVLPDQAAHTAGWTDYGGRFTSAVATANIFATQFHPEKSAADGLRLFRNFLHWQPDPPPERI